MDQGKKRITIGDRCSGCGACLPACSNAALSLETEQPSGWGRKIAVVEQNLCTGCGGCLHTCRFNAIELHISS